MFSSSLSSFLRDNGYKPVPDYDTDYYYEGSVGSSMISIHYHDVAPEHDVRWAKANGVDLPSKNYYHITRLVGFAFDETYITEDVDEALDTLEYLTEISKSPTTNEAIAIHQSMNQMVDMLNDKTGNTGRFSLPDII